MGEKRTAARRENLGVSEIKQTDRNVNPFPLQPGDRILLCSDGLYRALLEKEMAGELKGDPQDAAESLVENALSKKRDHQDNVTVVILGCDSEAVSSDGERSQKSQSSGLTKIFFSAALLVVLGFAGWTYRDRITNVAHISPEKEKTDVSGLAAWTYRDGIINVIQEKEKVDDFWCCP
ncbi:MAG: hypothetical protein DRI57_26025 [Deltaproteobacteria bacterium]|nr:MAG: hypothetical protein DRI57_26025 [Deltaproteobacteria bacterium]